MSPKMTHLTMDTAAGGVAPEMFAAELEKVLANIRDPDTSDTAKREIHVIFSFTPRERKGAVPNEMVVGVRTKKKLADIEPQSGAAFISRTPGGPAASTNDPVQEELEFREAEQDQGAVGPPPSYTSSAQEQNHARR